MKHRIINSRDPNFNDNVYSGDYILRVVAIIQAKNFVKLDDNSEVLTPNIALCIPTYKSSLVSPKD